MTILPATRSSLPFLKAMLFEAFFWDPAVPRPPVEEFLSEPEPRKLLASWGRPGDRALIAWEGGHPTGAAWYRSWTEENHSYGFVDAATPEIGIGVQAKHRSKGIGRAL